MVYVLALFTIFLAVANCFYAGAIYELKRRVEQLERRTGDDVTAPW